MVQGNQWSFREIDYVYKHYNVDGAESVSKVLGRSVTSVISKAEKLNLKRKGEFQKYELDYASTYGRPLGGAMIFLIPDRTSLEVKELIKCKNTH